MTFCMGSALQAASITFTVDPTQNNSSISPLSYGSNQDIGVTQIPLYRQGGNRMTGYNWENNASNAGMDYGPNHEDWYLLSTMNPAPPQNGNQLPATVVCQFINNNNAVNASSLITVQMAGYVSADGNCNCVVSVTGAADSAGTYWKQVVNINALYPPYPGAPVTTDDFVYMNEFLHYLFSKVGTASTTGAKYYCLDNEPGIWQSTHPLIHPNAVGCAEVANKGISMATLITSMDPAAQVLGPVCYGWGEYTNNSNAPDDGILATYDNGNYIPYLNYYLAQMKTASQTTGRRLLNYLDLHWYPEAQGNGVRITNDDVTQPVAIARMQAPRSLWDPTYTETSWIAQSSLPNTPITLIPRLQAAVSQYYPGTKLSFSEYQYGSGEDISGGVAQADALGILGKYGVFATRWDDGTSDTYVKAAYYLYLNYDGSNSKFGDTSILSTTSSVTETSIYAAKDNSHPNRINVILLNKDYTSNNQASVTLNNLSGGQQISGMRVFRFDSTTYNLYTPGTAPTTTTNTFTDTLPYRSATLYEITLSTSFPTFTPTVTQTPTITPTFTKTATSTPSSTPTGTPTPTFTSALTSTYTPTTTFSLTPTTTGTPTNSPTITDTPTINLTPSATFTVTYTPTWTGTFTWTGTPSFTATPTLTPSPTFTRTTTWTPSFTNTATFTNTSTTTSSATLTPTVTSTAALNAQGPISTPVPFPNPDRGNLPVTVAFVLQNQTPNLDVKMFTTAFRKVWHTQMTNVAAGYTRIPLPLNVPGGINLANGIYYIVVSDGKNRGLGKLMLIH